jgi:hypothetical protein
MPKKEIDYSKAIVYMLCCKDPSIPEIYIGSTTNFTKRKNLHKRDCNNPTRKAYNYCVYQFIRDHGGFENWQMILVEKYPCTDKLELLKRERELTVERGATLNMVHNQGIIQELGRSGYRKQYHLKYYEQKKDDILTKRKEYYENNKDKKSEYNKDYSQKNKEKIAQQKSIKFHCGCGASCRYGEKARHYKSQKHQRWFNAQIL